MIVLGLVINFKKSIDASVEFAPGASVTGPGVRRGAASDRVSYGA